MNDKLLESVVDMAQQEIERLLAKLATMKDERDAAHERVACGDLDVARAEILRWAATLAIRSTRAMPEIEK